MEKEQIGVLPNWCWVAFSADYLRLDRFKRATENEAEKVTQCVFKMIKHLYVTLVTFSLVFCMLHDISLSPSVSVSHTFNQDDAEVSWVRLGQTT